MFRKLFRIGMTGKLEDLIEQAQKDRYSCGNQIHCSFTERGNGKYGFSAGIYTTNPHLGNVNGWYGFFQSKGFGSFGESVIALTEEVAKTRSKIPDLIFFRSFGLCSEEAAKKYLLEYENIKNREEWLENAIDCEWNKEKFHVEEQFENGSWTPFVTQESERLNILTGSIEK